MTDPNRTQLGAPPTLDPNRTMMGSAPTLNATQTIKPVQCPVCKTFNPVGVMFCVECGLIFDRALPGDAFGAPAIQLPCLVDSSGREHPIRPGVTVIGRTGDIMIEDSRVSRRHAEINSENGEISVEDLGSTNGTKVNDVPLTFGTKQAIVSGDKLSLGGVELTLGLPGESAKTEMGLSGRTAAISAPPTAKNVVARWVSAEMSFDLEPGINSFGRRGDNQIQIADPYVSGRHGEIDVTESGIFLTDTGSTNGTVVNDAKLAPNQRTEIGPDDVVKLGNLEFRIEPV